MAIKNIDSRVPEIDGIRGWAALCVLFYHLIWETFGADNPGFRSPALRFFLDGPLAVYVFFILSGDALSLGFTCKSGKGVSTGVVLKRYFRLAGPVLFSCAFVYTLMKLGFVYNQQAGLMVNRTDWLGAFIQFDPSLLKMIRHGLFQAFTDLSIDNSYNPFLWPMGIEFVGSLMVFCFGYLKKDLKNPEKILCFISLFLWILGSFYALFFIGILFGMLRQRGKFENARKFDSNRIVTIFSLLAVIVIDGFSQRYSFRSPQFFIMMAMSVVAIFYSSKDISGFMDWPISRFLGKISFPLYFMHFAVIVSYTSWVIVYFYGKFEVAAYFYFFAIISSAFLAVGLAYFVEFAEAAYLSKVNAGIRKILK